MPKTVAIIQSSYIPWKGHFDIISQADEFILYDDAQYTKRDWRNRNRIKTAHGPLWLTIPVKVKGRYCQRICDVEIAEHGWSTAHWSSIRHHYARAAYFGEYGEWLQSLYEEANQRRLSLVNVHFIAAICRLLGIQTQLTWSMDYGARDSDPTARLVELCEKARADIYLSGPQAQAYLNENVFAEAGIEVRYMDYAGYPEYEQLFPPFEHHVSIIDLILNTGSDATKFMKGTK